MDDDTFIQKNKNHRAPHPIHTSLHSNFHTALELEAIKCQHDFIKKKPTKHAFHYNTHSVQLEFFVWLS